MGKQKNMRTPATAAGEAEAGTRAGTDTSTGPLRQAALVLGAGIGLASGYSAAYFGTLSVLLGPIAASFHWGRAETSLVAVLAQLGIAIGAPLLGGLMVRYGARRVIAPSIVLFALGLFLLTVLPNSLPLFGAVSLLIGFVAVATTPAGYLSVLGRSFDKKLGLALGLAMLGLGIGTVVWPMVVQRWVATSGWQGAYRSVATVVLILGAVALALVFWFARGGMPAGSAQHAANATLPGDEFSAAIRSNRFWLIALLFFSVSTAGLGAVVHWVPMLVDRGISPAEAAKGASLIGVGVMIGRFGAGPAMDYLHASFVAAFAFLMGAVGLAVIALSPDASFAVIALGATLLGLAIGAEGDFIPFFVRRYFGLRKLSLFYGVFLGIYSLGGVVGPVLYGMAFDRLGSYTPAFSLGAGVCAICAVASLTLGRYRYAAPGAAAG